MVKQPKLHQAFLDWVDRLDQFLAENKTLMLYRQAVADLKAPIKSDAMRVAVIGEVNAGKSSLMNALYGSDILPVDSAPCTTSVKELPVQNGILFTDTPGTNAQAGQFNESVQNCIAKADLILVVLPAKNPFGQSIWTTLTQLHALGNKQLRFVVQQCDLLSSSDLQGILSYLRDYAIKNGVDAPAFFPVSVKNWTAGQTQESGIPALTQELKQLQNTLQDSTAVLHIRFQSANALLQKIRTQIEGLEVSSAQAESFQQEIRQLIARNVQQNKVTSVQFERDFQAVLGDLDRQVGELSHAEAHFQDLKRENPVRELLGIARQRFDSRTQDLLLEFGTQLRDGFKRTGERISNLFLNEKDERFRVSRRTVLEQMDTQLEQIDSLVRADVQHVSASGGILDQIASESGLKSRALCAKARRKFVFTALLPIILLLFFVAVVPAAVQIIEAAKTQPASSSSSQVDGSDKLMKDIAGIATKSVTNNKSGSFMSPWLYLILGLVIFLVGTAYAAAVKKSTDKWLLMQLQMVGVGAHEALRQQLPAMQAAFSSVLQKTLEDSEAMLMETVVGFLSTNSGMSNAAMAHTQLQALSDFTIDLQKLRM